MFTKFASYKVPPVIVSTHGSVVPLAMFYHGFELKMVSTRLEQRDTSLSSSEGLECKTSVVISISN